MGSYGGSAEYMRDGHSFRRRSYAHVSPRVRAPRELAGTPFRVHARHVSLLLKRLQRASVLSARAGRNEGHFLVWGHPRLPSPPAQAEKPPRPQATVPWEPGRTHHFAATERKAPNSRAPRSSPGATAGRAAVPCPPRPARTQGAAAKIQLWPRVARPRGNAGVRAGRRARHLRRRSRDCVCGRVTAPEGSVGGEAGQSRGEAAAPVCSRACY